MVAAGRLNYILKDITRISYHFMIMRIWLLGLQSQGWRVCNSNLAPHPYLSLPCTCGKREVMGVHLEDVVLRSRWCEPLLWPTSAYAQMINVSGSSALAVMLLTPGTPSCSSPVLMVLWGSPWWHMWFCGAVMNMQEADMEFDVRPSLGWAQLY